MPASRQSLIEAATSALGGSNMPTQPTNVRSVYMIYIKKEKQNKSKLDAIFRFLFYNYIIQLYNWAAMWCNTDYQSVPALTSYSIKRVESSNTRSSLFMGLSRVARARQRRVSLPVPYSLITDMSLSLMPGVKGTLLLPTRMCVHLSITPSGAPWSRHRQNSSNSRFYQSSKTKPKKLVNEAEFVLYVNTLPLQTSCRQRSGLC